MRVKTVEYRNGKLKIIDQRRLPNNTTYKTLGSLKDVTRAIKALSVRGAPAIGVCAAYGVYVSIRNLKFKKRKDFFKKLYEIVEKMKAARPTAVNLSWAMERIKAKACKNKNKSVEQICSILLKEAKWIHSQDEAMCRKIGEFGQRLLKNKDVVLTHCNAGALATAGDGTALSVIYAAKKRGKRIKVYADETRPLLQGARLTTWELMRKGIDVTLICDNMAASLMKARKVSKIIVGADRITANGDFANKIGTYNLALLGQFHKIPFYVCAPSSSFDFSLSDGKNIPIEQRGPDEVRKVGPVYIAPKNVKVYNPAFDVTPGELVTAFVTEKGTYRKPYRESLNRLKHETTRHRRNSSNK
ncbi:MAG: S-methyl-5-thioribose-1-phosphate isomerase [Candidatus Omnitrophota bacterium]